MMQHDDITKTIWIVVAKAIVEQSRGKYEQNPEAPWELYCSDSNVNLSCDAIAHAAIASSGWHEMREAMDDFLKLRFSKRGDALCIYHGDLSAIAEKIHFAIRLAGGEHT